jgi:hypothetical protein
MGKKGTSETTSFNLKTSHDAQSSNEGNKTK